MSRPSLTHDPKTWTPKRLGGTAPSALEFEYDPCSEPPEKLMLHLDEGGEVPIFRHHKPFVDLLEYYEKTILAGILKSAISPINACWRCRAHLRLASESIATLAGRLQWSLQANSGPSMASTFPATLSDPFLDAQPTAAGFPPLPRDQGATSYKLGGPRSRHAGRVPALRG